MDEDLIIRTEPATELAPVLQTTFAEVVADSTINAVFGGEDGKLSPAQAGLAAAVTSRMQDRLIEQIQQAHQRELGLISGFIRLYKVPMFSTSSPRSRGEKESGGKTKQKPSRFGELFSWET